MIGPVADGELQAIIGRVIAEDLSLLTSQSLADCDRIEVDNRPARPKQRLGLQHWRHDDPVRIQGRETLRQEGSPGGRVRGESRVGETLVPQHLGEQGHAPAAVPRVNGPGRDVADEHCLAIAICEICPRHLLTGYSLIRVAVQLVDSMHCLIFFLKLALIMAR
jgi:hypothetical protein